MSESSYEAPTSRALAATAPRPDRERALALAYRHGWNATALQTLKPGYRYFFYGDDACVAYVETPGAWVAAGAPLAAEAHLGAATRAFIEAARRAEKRCCFFAAEERLVSSSGGVLATMRIGEQPVWDSRAWQENLRGHRSLREQLRRARAKGVTVRAIEEGALTDGPTREGIARVTQRWQAQHAMPPMGFLVRVDLDATEAHGRRFVAEREGAVVGHAALIPVPSRGGWFLEELVRDPAAPNGTSELLVDAAMRWCAERASPWVTLGLAPLAGDVAGWLRAVRSVSAPLYDFEGLRAYKARLRPDHWVPLYLAFPCEQRGIVALLDALAAFSDGGLVRFGWRALRKLSGAAVRRAAARLRARSEPRELPRGA